MAFSTDTHEAVFTAVAALYTADSGSGGLSNSSGNQYVRAFLRDGDPRIQESQNWPFIVVRITDSEDRRFDKAGGEVVVELHVYCKRDDRFVKQNAVNTRVRTVFDGVAPSTSGGWVFSILNRLRGFQGPSSRNELHYVHQFSLRTCE